MQAVCEKASRISVGPERPGGQTAAMGLEAGQHQPERPEFALAALEANEPPVGVNVERLRSQTLEQVREMGAGEGLVVDGAVQRAHPGGVPVIVDDLRIRAAREQGFDQRDVSGACGEHQRGRAAIGLVVDAVEVAVLQDGLCRSFEIGPQLPLAHRRRRARRAAHRVARIVREPGNLGEFDELAILVKNLRDAGRATARDGSAPARARNSLRRAFRHRRPVRARAHSRAWPVWSWRTDSSDRAPWASIPAGFAATRASRASAARRETSPGSRAPAPACPAVRACGPPAPIRPCSTPRAAVGAMSAISLRSSRRSNGC